eukprot:1883087-Prorocentrum_lima.AAC.1
MVAAPGETEGEAEEEGGAEEGEEGARMAARRAGTGHMARMRQEIQSINQGLETALHLGSKQFLTRATLRIVPSEWM